MWNNYHFYSTTFSSYYSYRYNFSFKIIAVLAPLAELSGYSSMIRTITSGTASMSMQPYGYTLMEQQYENAAIKKAQGLE